jgi:hypothetical protein
VEPDHAKKQGRAKVELDRNQYFRLFAYLRPESWPIRTWAIVWPCLTATVVPFHRFLALIPMIAPGMTAGV